MKTLSRVLISVSALSLLAAPLTFAGVEKTDNPGAMPQMLFYEAAEQAAEESYAVIVPSSDEKKAEKEVVDGKAEQATDAAVDATAEDKAPKKAE